MLNTEEFTGNACLGFQKSVGIFKLLTRLQYFPHVQLPSVYYDV